MSCTNDRSKPVAAAKVRAFQVSTKNPRSSPLTSGSSTSTSAIGVGATDNPVDVTPERVATGCRIRVAGPPQPSCVQQARATPTEATVLLPSGAVTSHDPSGRPRPVGPLEMVLEELSSVVRQADEVAAAVANGDPDAADRAAALSDRVRDVRRSVEWLGVRLASVDDSETPSRPDLGHAASAPGTQVGAPRPADGRAHQAGHRGTTPAGNRKAPKAASTRPGGRERRHPCPPTRQRPGERSSGIDGRRHPQRAATHGAPARRAAQPDPLPLLRVGGGGQRLDRRHPRVAGRNPSLPGESGSQHQQRQLLPFLQPGRRHGDRGVRPAAQQRRRPDKPGLAGSDGRHPRRGPESWRLRCPAGLSGQAGKVVAGTRPGPHGSAPRDRLRVGGSGAPPGEPGAG